MNRYREPHIDQLPMTVEAVACFGKVPAHGDFVRHNVNSPALEALDEWMTESIHAIRTRGGGPPFDEVMDGAGTFRFVFEPRGSHYSAGVMFPSRDTSGRRHPFVIAAEVPFSGSGARIPARISSVLDSLEERARPVVNGTAPFSELVDAFEHQPPDPDFQTADEAFDRFLEQRTGEFWRRLYGSFDDSRKYLLLKNLLDIFRSGEPVSLQDMAYGLIWPTIPDEPGAAACTSFWISLCEALSGDVFESGAAFWHASASVLFFQPPSPAAFRDLMLGELDSDFLFEVDRAGSGNAALAALSIPSRQGEVLERTDVTLADWLEIVREP